MAGLRIRWRFTILWTIVCLLAIGALVERAAKPIGAACIDNCDFELDGHGHEPPSDDL